MANARFYEEFKILIALWSEKVDLSFSIPRKLYLIIVASKRIDAILFQTASLPGLVYLNFRRCEQNHNRIKLNAI